MPNMPIKTIQDRSLSFAALGLLMHGLSKPNEKFSAKELAQEKLVNVAQIYRLLQELIRYGYVTRYRIRNENFKGFGPYVYTFYSTKIDKKSIVSQD